MQKNEIYINRHELKKRSHAVVRSHYVILVFLMLILSIYGTEFRYSLTGLGKSGSSILEGDGADAEEPGNAVTMNGVLSSKDVRESLLAGRLSEGAEKAKLIEQALREKAASSKVLGMTNGILAQMVNAVWSGNLLVRFAQTIRTVTDSDRDAAAIFILGSFFLYSLVYIFLLNVCSAVVRRMFLTARVYRHVSFLEVTHILAVRKWVNASLVMFYKRLLQTLWSLTIVGGVIKYYSYFAVPYIVAENPSVSAREAVLLSRRMMDGRKMELFKYQLTFAGWILLGVATLGISDLIYGNAYRMAAYTEFYVRVREKMKEKDPDAAAILNDRYLFETADRILLTETYFDVVDEITLIHENRITLTGAAKRLASWFGIWIGSLRKKKEYDELEGRKHKIEGFRLSMNGEAYPQWLNPLWRRKEIEKMGSFNYLRSYSVWTLILLFILFSFVGWGWEVMLHYMQTGQFANRGTLLGPWLPIYGSGGAVVLLLCSRFRDKPVLEFFIATGLCGGIEYFAAWSLETRYHTRWWSYDGYFLNLHGRICAEGLLVFGISCLIVVYLIAPLFDFLLSRVKPGILIACAAVLGILFTADAIHAGYHPNMSEGAIEADIVAETDDVNAG